MIRRWIFLLVLVILGLVIFYNPNFKTIAAGISILLFGMVTLEQGFKVFAKGPLRRILKKATEKLYKSISVGALVTAIIQSSSLVSVITISFISAGLISLSGGIGLIYGANIGTTFTAWLVAGFGLKVNISVLAMPMLIFGILFSFQHNKSLKGLGNILTGLGFFFLGIYYMKDGFDVFSNYIDLTQYSIEGWPGIFVYTGIGILITTILQSSSASLAIVLTALAAGQITYENALALAIGTNIGTTITAVIGSIGSNIAGKRLAAAHLIFNVVTGLVALVFIIPLSNLVNFLSDSVGIATDDFTLKLALFHTLFNILGVLIMIPFIGHLEKFLVRFITESRSKDIDEPKFLNKAVLEFPGTLVTSLEKETRYLFENAIFEIIAHAVNLHRTDLASDLKTKAVVKKSQKDIDVNIRELYLKKVKSIYGQILEYATKGQAELTLEPPHNQRITEIKIANRKMVAIIRDVKELRMNVLKYTQSDNPQMRKQYEDFMRMIVMVLRGVNRMKEEKDELESKKEIAQLKKSIKAKLKASSKSINKLIRENLIDINMASSLANDHDNVKEMTKMILQVCELLYVHKDSLLEPSEPVPDHVDHNTG